MKRSLSLILVVLMSFMIVSCNKKEQEKQPEKKVEIKDDLNGKNPQELDNLINYPEYVNSKEKLVKVIKNLHEKRSEDKIIFLADDKNKIEKILEDYNNEEKKSIEDSLLVGDMEYIKESSVKRPIFSMKLKSQLNKDFSEKEYDIKYTYRYIDELNKISKEVKGKTDMETVKNLAMKLIDGYKYDPGLSSAFACDLLFNKEGTCNSFSELANDILNNCGIYSEIWWVDSLPDDELDKESNPYRNHSIDRAELDGKMYFLDFTHSTISNKSAKNYGFDKRPKLIMDKLPEVEKGKNQLYTGYSKVREPILVHKGFSDGTYNIENPYKKYSDLELGWTTYGDLLNKLQKNPYFK